MVSELAVNSIDKIFDKLQVDLNRTKKMFVGPCPIHNGDNPSAFNLYFDGHTVKGYWKCRSHLCHQTFGATFIGFVRGVLSNQRLGWENDGDRRISFKDSVDYICNILDTTIHDIKVSGTDINKRQFISQNQSYSTNGKKQKILRSCVRQHLKMPCEYYLNRRYSEEILNIYDVGTCLNNNREMCGRAVVPIYDDNYHYMIGCTGRTIFQQCNICKHYHNPDGSCPSKPWDIKKSSKWYTNKGFTVKSCLYNYWFSKKHIQETGLAILVEGPGDVWRLTEQNINNVIGIFGCELSDEQQIILEKSGAMSIMILMDNDRAGNRATEQMKKILSRSYRLHIPEISSSDIGEMDAIQINSIIKPEIERILA